MDVGAGVDVLVLQGYQNHPQLLQHPFFFSCDFPGVTKESVASFSIKLPCFLDAC